MRPHNGSRDGCAGSINADQRRILVNRYCFCAQLAWSGPRRGARRRAGPLPVGPDRAVPGRGGLEGRQAGHGQGDPGARGLAGQARGVGAIPAGRDDGLGASEPAGRPAVLVCVPGVRPGHARWPQPADAAGDVAGLHRFPGGHGVHAAGDPRARPVHDRPLRGRGAETRPVPHVLRRHPARGPAHAHARRGEGVCAHGRARRHRRHGPLGVHERRVAVRGSDALERREGAARRRGLCQVSRVARQAGPRRGVQGVLGSLRRVHAHARRHAATRRSSRTSSNKDVHKFATSLDASLFDFNIPRQRLHAAARGRAREPADAAPLPEAAPEDHGPAAARLRGPLRADRAAGGPEYTPEEAQALTLEAFAPLGPTYVDDLRKGYARALGGLHADDRQELGRLQQHRLRRAPVPAA